MKNQTTSQRDLALPSRRSKSSIFTATVGLIVLGVLWGMGISSWLAPDSDVASFAGFIALPMVMAAGYLLWRQKIIFLVIRLLGRKLLTVFLKTKKGEKRKALESLLSDQVKLSRIVERVNKYANSFQQTGVFMGILAGSLLALVADKGRSLTALSIFLVSASFYGMMLTYFARQGFLLPPEEL